MKVTVRYFASIREAIGHGNEIIETDATTVDALRELCLTVAQRIKRPCLLNAWCGWH